MDMLLGKVVPLQMGYVGVINRSQQDIAAKLPIRAALENEKKFFQQHALYRSIASRCGTQFLAKSLNKILMHHIRDTLPELKQKINKVLVLLLLLLLFGGCCCCLGG
jgi:replication fork clamp-binding protein CrfC